MELYSVSSWASLYINGGTGPDNSVMKRLPALGTIPLSRTLMKRNLDGIDSIELSGGSFAKKLLNLLTKK